MKNQLIAICSGTKGIGKTWLAVNLCHCLSLLKNKVLYFDADCGIENISYQLGLNIDMSYKNILNGSTTINNSVIKNEKTNFDIIGTAPGGNVLSSAPMGRIQVFSKDLFCFSKFYDYTVIDCADDDTKSINSFINICNLVILIVNADSTSSEKAYKKIETLKKINPKTEIKIIINRALSYNEGNQIYKSLLKASQSFIDKDITLLGIIRQDTRIRDSVLNKSFLLNRYPESEGAEDLIKISQIISMEYNL